MDAVQQRRLVETLAEVADHLVDDYDVGDVLTLLCTRAVELFDGVRASGILLAGVDGLGLAATSGEAGSLLEFFQLKVGDGACIEAYETGEPVLEDDLETAEDRWSEWAPAAVAAGFRSVTSIPLRLRDERLGAMNMFGLGVGALAGDELHAALALAQVATTSVLAHRRLVASTDLASQLQHALDSRVQVEQAKGALAERLGISPEKAFELLRKEARSTRRPISAVAAEAVIRR